MDEYRISRKPKISRRASHEMILLFARSANHYTTREPFRADADVKRAFQRNGIDYDRLVESCRDPSQNVPFFENLIGSSWTVSDGATVSRVDLTTGKESSRVEGPGTFSPDGYWTTYEVAHAALERAAAGCKYGELLTAIVQGVASIEAFLTAQVLQWNDKHPEAPLLDSRDKKVSLDEKLDEWIPQITGKWLDKSDSIWQHFRRLRGIRDNAAIHPKSAGHSVGFQEMVDLINMFRTGIAGMLIELHRLFDVRIPRVIIRDRYAPDAELVKVIMPGSV